MAKICNDPAHVEMVLAIVKHGEAVERGLLAIAEALRHGLLAIANEIGSHFSSNHESAGRIADSIDRVGDILNGDVDPEEEKLKPKKALTFDLGDVAREIGHWEDVTAKVRAIHHLAKAIENGADKIAAAIQLSHAGGISKNANEAGE